MKIFKFLAVALVAMLGFTACEKDCDHDFIEVDHSKDLVGTWTCFQEGFANALVIKADGSMVSTGVLGEEYWENLNGTISVKDGKATLNYEDGVTIEGHFDIIPGMAFSIVQDNGERVTFNYCKEDLSDEIVGMWVSTDNSPVEEHNMFIQTFYENGKSTYTGFGEMDGEIVVKKESNYKVIGDVSFQEINGKYIAWKLSYSHNGTLLGDIMTNTNGDYTSTWLRIKQHLELPGTKYNYMKTFVTNVKGEDKDIPFLNTSFNFAKMDGSIIDKFLKSILFTVEFPEANKIKYSYLLEGQNVVMEAPVQVDGNKMTIKMSANNPAYQDVDMYAFQDQDNTQMHWYMPTTSFEKFFGNTSVALMLGYGQLDKDDTEGIANVYKTIADAVESINLSLVMTKAK